jgi:mannan endo-1,4-beta-mannosidase
MRSLIFRKTSAAVMAAAMAINITAAGVLNTAVAADALKFEFEDAKISGDITVEDNASASGEKCLKMTESGTIDLTVTVPAAGSYQLVFYAGGIGSDKQNNLAVNGKDQGAIGIPESKGFEKISIPAVSLNAGENTITITKSWGWSNFDYVEVISMADAKISATQVYPSDEKATKETKALMAYLASVYGKNIISGQQEIYSGGPHGLETEFEYLKDLTGHYPAIRGFDYGNFCCPAFGSDDGSTKRVLNWVKEKNGIATSSFHLNVPKNFASYSIGDRIDWSNTTYGAKDTDFSPENAATPGTKENEYYMQALETLAAEFKKLEAEGVPVIWRPLHEAEGGGGETGSWFWWGREGSDAYKKLWIYTYNTLTEKFGCHNLIWEWNSYNFSSSADWYPGDAYVDIIGYDKYNCTDWSTGSAVLKHNDSAIASTFYGIAEKYNNAKMISMAENDCFSTPDNLINDKAGWLYFCTWYDGGSQDTNFLSGEVFNTKEDTISMYQSDYCITLDELPADLYTAEPPEADPSVIVTKPAVTTADPSITTTTKAPDPTKNEGKVKKLKSSFQVTLPEAAKEFYLEVSLPEGVTYANGGLGTNVKVEGKDYWVNVMWEASKSGDIKVVPEKNFLNCTDGSAEVEDEAVIEAAKAALADITSYEGQIWWASDSAGDETEKDGVEITGVFTKKDSGTTTTAAPTDAPADVSDANYGDANCDGKITVADAVAVLQFVANKTKYPLDEKALINADVDGEAGITGSDAIVIQRVDANLVKQADLPLKK